MKSNLAEDEMVDEGKLRVLEFYSGIGGMVSSYLRLLLYISCLFGSSKLTQRVCEFK